MMNKKLLTLLCAHAIIAPTLPNLPVYSDIIRPLASGITLLERIKQEEISSKAEGRQSHAAHLRALQQEQLQINHEYVQALSAVINAESLNNWVQRTTVMYPASFGGDQTTVRYSRPWGQQTTGVMHAPGFGGQQLQPWWQQTTDVMHMQSLHANRQKAIQAQYASTMQHANPQERESIKQIEQAQAESVKQAVTHILRVKTITKDSELAPLTAKAATRVSNTIDEAVAQARTEEQARARAIADAVAQARIEEQAPNNLQNDLGDM